MDALNAEIGRLRLEVHNLKGESGAQNISIGNYLLVRLEQLGVKSMFGVPGDFNLEFLDLVEDHPSIDWVGNCNELNAAYAADGYARVKENSIGAITTTFGVGELSAINGIAGAFSEMVPVLHIVGYPSTVQQKMRPLLHHTLGDGRYDAYQRAAAQFVIYEANLSNKETAAAEIDMAITQCITKARPVYIALPMDLVKEEISSDRLSVPLSSTRPPNDPDTELFVLDLIQDRVIAAGGDVVVLVDACVIRHHCRNEVLDLLKRTGFPVYGTPMGKTAIEEDHDRYGGIYIGALSNPSIRENVENAKIILSIGLLSSDFNTGNFSYAIPTIRHIELHSDYCKVQHARFDNIAMKHLLPKLTDRLQQFHAIASKIRVPALVNEIPKEDSQVITHAWFWPRLGQFFKPKDVIVTETGTSNFGIIDVTLPGGTMLLSQILWGSIGWSVGSALGAALAARDKGGNRVVLFVGEGSLQVSVQELSPMIRKGLTPIVFVINNSGYTIERCIHGENRHYNDVANWNWTALLDAMHDGGNHNTVSYTVRTKGELERLLVDSAFAKAENMQLVEVVMEKFDAPRALIGHAKK